MGKVGNPKPMVYDTYVNMRFKRETIEKLKRITPKYQPKIRQLVEEYVREQERIENIEQARRDKYRGY